MLGFSYHPGGVVWSIWLSERVFGFLPLRELVVRLPFIAMMAGVLFEFWKMAGPRIQRFLWILAAGGVWASSWLAVPDALLLLGLVLAFGGAREERPWKLGLGIALGLFAKFSGILVVASAVYVCRTNRRLLKAVVLGGAVGLLPTIFWNIGTDFQPLQFQLLQRHRGYQPSLGRWVGFWGTQAALVGPLFFWGIWRLLKERKASIEKAFLLPPLLVFGIQPLFAPFKLHWGLPFWVVAMAGLLAHDLRPPRALVRFQMIFGFTIYAVLGLIFQFPILSQWVSPLKDPGADLRGWDELKPFVEKRLGPSGLDLRIVGSRYQTAAQAAFHWKHPERVTLYPKTGTEVLEWPDLAPGRFLYVADERYSDPPSVPWAHCQELGKLGTNDGATRGKWIQLWDCLPVGQSFNEVVTNPDKSG